jgi:hypothetical protein
MTGIPPVLKLIAFLAVLAAVYELWPRFLWATAGLIGLYLVLTNGDKVSALFDAVPAGFTNLIRPGEPGVGAGGAGVKP